MVKKPKLTPEERQQRKYEKKLAKQLAIEEQKRQIKRDYLARELRYARHNKQNLEKYWTKMLLSIKLPILRIEFQLAVNNADRIIDNKDFQISILMDELDDAEEQYIANLREHVNNMDKFLGLFHSRLDDLKHKYDNEYKSLILEANQETCLLKQKLNEENENVNTMIYRLEYERKDVDKELRSAYLSKLNEETSRNLHELQLMIQNKENTFENTWTLFKNILNDYTINTAERRKETDDICLRDGVTKNLINEQTSQLAQLQRILLNLKEQQICEKDDLDRDVECKLKERNYFSNVYEFLRKQLDVDCKFDNEQLTILVITSNNCIKILERKAKRCESVIKLYEIIRKRETKKEKLQPFPSQLPPIKQKTVSIVGSKFYAAPKELDAFWMKCGQGDALRNCINEEREYLKRENNYLKQHVANYCLASKYAYINFKINPNVKRKG